MTTAEKEIELQERLLEKTRSGILRWRKVVGAGRIQGDYITVTKAEHADKPMVIIAGYSLLSQTDWQDEALELIAGSLSKELVDEVRRQACETDRHLDRLLEYLNTL